MKLILSSENFSDIPYTFSMTNIRVYSIEEAIWHIFNHLKESLEIFEDNSFFDWLKDKLGLYDEAKLLEGSSDDSNEKKLIDFLRKFSYINENEIEDIKKRFGEFSNLGEYEKHKETGDKLYRAGKYQKAVYAYSKALKFDINKESVIKNNIGLCCMQCGDYENAAGFFEQAYNMDKNYIILLNYAESCIFLNFIDKAEYLLSQYKGDDLFSVLYLKGIIALNKGEYKKSIEILKRALSIKEDASAMLKISDIYIKQRQFSTAVKFLEECKIISPRIFKRLAEIYCAEKNYSAAIKTIEKGLIHFRNNIDLWITLAKCYRLNLDFNMAEGAACKALTLNNESEAANLELAIIKKCQGKSDKYHQSLNKCLEIIKNKYLYDIGADEK